MRGILINDLVIIPQPQTDEYRDIIRRRLIKLEKKFSIVDVVFHQVTLTAKEQEEYNKKHTPKYPFYAVLTKAQLGNFLGISEQDLDEAFALYRQNLAGTKCIYSIRETIQWYKSLPVQQKSLVYPRYNPDPEQYPNLETIYDYLDANRAEWEEAL